ncbi:MAG: hypothetical protein AB7M12_06145 [Hyphomonadaceae bacterium]
MTDAHSSQDARFENWLAPPSPCENMRVFDRYGVFVGRIKSVQRDDRGAPCAIAFQAAIGPRRMLRVPCARCRVRGEDVHTTWALFELDEIEAARRAEPSARAAPLSPQGVVLAGVAAAVVDGVEAAGGRILASVFTSPPSTR